MTRDPGTEDDLDRRLLAATSVAREAGRLAMTYFRNPDRLRVEHKGHQDLVSVADRAAEDVIRNRLAAAFPGDAFLGEEGGGGYAERLWIIDPIDGTSNFVRGVPYWSVVVAYVIEGKPEIAVTYDPVHDELFAARRGRGTTRDGASVAVSARPVPDEACVGLTFNFKQPVDAYAELVRGIASRGLDHRRLGSTALALCHVADGRIEALVTLDAQAWDVMAGLLLVAEAGGVASDYTDGCAITDRRGVIACVPALEGQVRDVSGIGT